MAEQLHLAEDDAKIVRRNGSLFAVVIDGAIPEDDSRVNTIIDNLTAGGATQEQRHVLHTVVRPALEAYGTE